jgi:hypothetical protein
LVRICYKWRQWIKILGLLCKYWKWRWHNNRFRFGCLSTTDAGDRLMWYCWSCFDLRLVWSQCGSMELTAGLVLEKHSRNNQSEVMVHTIRGK